MGNLVPGLSKLAVRSTRKLRSLLAQVGFYKGNRRFCPVCGRSARRFIPFGYISRPEAQCPHCGALERHRLLWLYLERKTDLFDGRAKTMLHVAPERCLEPKLRQQLGEGYLTADLAQDRAMVQMDITDIRYAEQSFDVIYCSHVLVYIKDDHKALSEFHRVLKKGGWAILLEPVNMEHTVDDPAVVEAEDSAKVRKYGPDYLDRLRETGFRVEVTRIGDLIGADEAVRLGLSGSSDEIYYCTKRA